MSLLEIKPNENYKNLLGVIPKKYPSKLPFRKYEV